MRIKDSVKQNRIGGVVLSWATIAIQAVLSLFFTPFFLKMVGDRQYGLYSFSSSLVSWLTTLLVAITGGYYKYLAREQANNKEEGERRVDSVFFDIFIVLAFITLIVGIGFDALIAKGVIRFSNYSITETKQICVLVLISVLSSFIMTACTARKNYPYYRQKYIFIYSINLLTIISSTLFSFIFLKKGHGVLSVSIVQLSVSVFFTIITCFYSRFILKERFIFIYKDKDHLQLRKTLTREILVFSLFILVTEIAAILHKNLDKTLLGIYNPDLVTNYALAYTFVTYLISFTSIIGVIYGKSLAKSYYEGGIAAMNEVHLRASKVQTIIACGIVGGFACIGSDFITLWLGERRDQVFLVGLILLIIYSLSYSRTTATPSRSLLDLHKKSAFMMLGIVIGNILISVILITILPKEKAIYACVIGTAVSSFIGEWVLLPMFDQVKTGLNVKKFYLYYCFIITLSLLIAFVIHKVGKIYLREITSSLLILILIEAICYGVIYLSIIIILDKKMRKSLLTMVTRIKKHIERLP